MATRKGKCLAGHDAHPDCNLHCCAITPERGAEIAAQARSGINWAELSHPGPACVCGLSKTMICPVHG